MCVRIAVAVAERSAHRSVPDESLGELVRSRRSPAHRPRVAGAVTTPGGELALPDDRRERRPCVIRHLELRFQGPILVRTLRRHTGVAELLDEPAGRPRARRPRPRRPRTPASRARGGRGTPSRPIASPRDRARARTRRRGSPGRRAPRPARRSGRRRMNVACAGAETSSRRHELERRPRVVVEPADERRGSETWRHARLVEAGLGPQRSARCRDRTGGRRSSGASARDVAAGRRPCSRGRAAGSSRTGRLCSSSSSSRCASR